jgi:hypothetical protein
MNRTRLLATLAAAALGTALLTGCAEQEDDCRYTVVYLGNDGLYRQDSPTGPVVTDWDDDCTPVTLFQGTDGKYRPNNQKHSAPITPAKQPAAPKAPAAPKPKTGR